jgi:signal transduction histidine kinase
MKKDSQSHDGLDLPTLLAAAAHELVEPLIAIDAYAASVSDRLNGRLDHDSREELERLRVGVYRARLLAETLLQRGTDGAIERAPVDIGEVVRDCVRRLEREIHLRQAVVEVGELPVVDGDETLLQALFANLLRNALKYGPRRGGTIAVEATAGPGSWRFAVSSEGVPISEVDRERIFDVYERGPHERRTRGAGLGLTICRDVVEQHGGTIGVTPLPGGNRFHFTLPRAT